MKLLNDREYFTDIQANGTLSASSTGGIPSAKSVFDRLTEHARKTDEGISVSAFYDPNTRHNDVEKQFSYSFQRQITIRERTLWRECIAALDLPNRTQIGEFPRPEYRLYTLSSSTDGYEVSLNATSLISDHEIPKLRDLRVSMNNARKQRKSSRQVRCAAWLSVVNLLLNSLFFLGYQPGFKWAHFVIQHGWHIYLTVLVGVLFGLALLLHRFNSDYRGFENYCGDAFAWAFLVAVNACSSPEILQIPELRFLAYGTGLVSLCYCVYFVWLGIRENRDRHAFRRLAQEVDQFAPSIHKELRFLALWYQHITGQSCDNLIRQEQELNEVVAYTKKHI